MGRTPVFIFPALRGSQSAAALTALNAVFPINSNSAYLYDQDYPAFERRAFYDSQSNLIVNGGGFPTGTEVVNFGTPSVRPRFVALNYEANGPEWDTPGHQTPAPMRELATGAGLPGYPPLGLTVAQAQQRLTDYMIAVANGAKAYKRPGDPDSKVGFYDFYDNPGRSSYRALILAVCDVYFPNFYLNTHNIGQLPPNWFGLTEGATPKPIVPMIRIDAVQSGGLLTATDWANTFRYAFTDCNRATRFCLWGAAINNQGVVDRYAEAAPLLLAGARLAGFEPSLEPASVIFPTAT